MMKTVNGVNRVVYFSDPDILTYIGDKRTYLPDFNPHIQQSEYPEELQYCDGKACYNKKEEILFNQNLPNLKNRIFNRCEFAKPTTLQDFPLQQCPNSYKDDSKDYQSYKFMHPYAVTTEQSDLLQLNGQTYTKTVYQPVQKQIIGTNFIEWQGTLFQDILNQKYIMKVISLSVDKLTNTLTILGQLQEQTGITICSNMGLSCVISNQNKDYSSFNIQGVIYMFKQDTISQQLRKYYMIGTYQQNTGITGKWGSAYEDLSFGNIIFEPIKIPYSTEDIRSFEYIPLLITDDGFQQDPQTSHFVRRCRKDPNQDPECLITNDSVCRNRYIANKQNNQLNDLIYNYCKHNAPIIDQTSNSFKNCNTNWNSDTNQYKQWKQQVCTALPTKQVQFVNQNKKIVQSLPIFMPECIDQFDKWYSLLTVNQKEDINNWVNTIKDTYTTQFDTLQQQAINKFLQLYQNEVNLNSQPINYQTGLQDVQQTTNLNTLQNNIIDQQTNINNDKQQAIITKLSHVYKQTIFDKANNYLKTVQTPILYLIALIMIIIIITCTIVLIKLYQRKHKN